MVRFFGTLLFAFALLASSALGLVGAMDPSNVQRCSIEHRTSSELEAIATNAPPRSADELEPLIVDVNSLPAGVPADADILAEITVTAQMRAYCARESNLLAFWALYTDSYLTNLASFDEHGTFLDELEFATPVATMQPD